MFAALLLCLLVKSSTGFMGSMEIIAFYGYPAEEHKVTTNDGYVLTMHRIPHGLNGSHGGRPVLLLHGNAGSSFDFLSQLPNRSLSYSLADAGYDVWLGNDRGNIYSTSHVHYSSLDARFWNFSWDEMAASDIPAMINYMLTVTNRTDLYVIGYSQGVLTLIASATSRPEIQLKVKHFFGLAPGLSQASLRWVPGIAQTLISLIPSQVFALPVLTPLCGTPILRGVCKFIIGALVGPADQLDDNLLAVVTAHFPSGTSAKNKRHTLQQAKATAHFDYGVEGNLAEYGTSYPRPYNFSAYHISTSFYHSPEDKICDPESMKLGTALIPASSIARSKSVTGFSHLDFVWGIRAKKEIYDEIIGDINRMEGKK